MRKIIPLPKLPKFDPGSPKVVKVLDKIRFEIYKRDTDGEFFELFWFLREYPRIYRNHLDCAEYRLTSIYNMYTEAVSYFESQIEETDDSSFGIGFSNHRVHVMYWDFESFLSSINTALDILARIIGTAYSEQTPVSFNKLCSKNLDGIVEHLGKAKSVWVSKMKDYRDCFTHYTSVDTMLMISASPYSNGWEVRAKLPTNPNSRDILKFKYSRRTELLKYAITTYKHMMALDRRIADEIWRLYKTGEYPKRTSNLFNIGIRQ